MSTAAPFSEPVARPATALPSVEHLPDDPATLKRMIVELIVTLRQTQRDQQALQDRLSRLLDRLYGRKTERFDPDQGTLFEVVPDAPAPDAAQPDATQPAATEAATPAQKRARPHGRRKMPANLERRPVHHVLTAAERLCQDCGQERIDIGVDQSEQLEYRPASLVVIEHFTHKYLCPCCSKKNLLATEPESSAPSEATPSAVSEPAMNDPRASQAAPVSTSATTSTAAATPAVQSAAAPSSAPAPLVIAAAKPTQPLPKGLPGPGLLAHLIVSKWVDHLPLHRLERVYERQGVVLPRSTLCDWLAASARLLQPLYDLMVTLALESRVLHTDDTPVKTQTPRGRSHELVTARLWTYLGDDAHPFNVFDFTLTRKRDGPQQFLADFQGYLQADAFSGYDGLYLPVRANGDARILEVACNAHARRKFYEARSSDVLRAHQALAYYGQLYDLERAAKGYDETRLLRIRQDIAVPILETFRAWLEQQKTDVLPKSPLGEAIGYALNNWAALQRYTAAGFLHIDNNVAEREMKRIAIGRKNWLFFGSAQGGKTAAIHCSFTSTCHRLGVEPWAYLQDVLTRLPSTPREQLTDLLPNHWAAARKANSAPTSDPAAPPPPAAPPS